jgi:peptidoglycan/xylan/chitin deacetylase (PgdA/CDA1 family)
MSLLSRLSPSMKASIRKRLGFVGSVIAVQTTLPQIVLTFDDGPDPVGTEAVISALAAHRATATFFVLMTRVRMYGSLLGNLLDAGHEIGLHGLDHQPLTSFNHAEAKRRTTDARAALEDHLGSEIRWFRPPYGRQTLRSWHAVTSSGLTPVMWGPTAWDWRDLPQRDRVWKAQQGAIRGAILLGHDAFANESDGASAQPAPVIDRRELVDQVLAAYADHGLNGVSLGTALEHGSAVMAARFRR